MSLKKVVLIAALVVLVMPAAALADGITFGLTGVSSSTTSSGHLNVPRPFVPGSTASTSGTVTLTYLTRMFGTVPYGPPGTATFGTPGTLVFPGTLINNDFGTVSFTTGGLISSSGLTSATFGPGGSFTIISGGTLGTATGGAIPNGTTLFSGSFSGPTTLTQYVGGTGNYPGCHATVTYCYTLGGPITGTVGAAVMSYFGLGSNPVADGLVISLGLGFNDNKPFPSGGLDSQGQIEGGLASVVAQPATLALVIPEPGTLALFGTGLIAVAGYVRRRFKT